MADFEHVYDKPPPGRGRRLDHPPGLGAYTEVEHQTWDDALRAPDEDPAGPRLRRRSCRGLDALDLNTAAASPTSPG